jgi:hypothetical protein
MGRPACGAFLRTLPSAPVRPAKRTKSRVARQKSACFTHRRVLACRWRWLATGVRPRRPPSPERRPPLHGHGQEDQTRGNGPSTAKQACQADRSTEQRLARRASCNWCDPSALRRGGASPRRLEPQDTHFSQPQTRLTRRSARVVPEWGDRAAVSADKSTQLSTSISSAGGRQRRGRAPKRLLEAESQTQYPFHLVGSVGRPGTPSSRIELCESRSLRVKGFPAAGGPSARTLHIGPYPPALQQLNRAEQCYCGADRVRTA